ncbi:unnamed protein product [Camellia sinensis]
MQESGWSYTVLGGNSGALQRRKEKIPTALSVVIGRLDRREVGIFVLISSVIFVPIRYWTELDRRPRIADMSHLGWCNMHVSI